MANTNKPTNQGKPTSGVQSQQQGSKNTKGTTSSVTPAPQGYQQTSKQTPHTTVTKGGNNSTSTQVGGNKATGTVGQTNNPNKGSKPTPKSWS